MDSSVKSSLVYCDLLISLKPSAFSSCHLKDFLGERIVGHIIMASFSLNLISDIILLSTATVIRFINPTLIRKGILKIH